VVFEQIVPDVTMREEKDPATGIINMVILEGKGDLHPQIVIEDAEGRASSAYYAVPEKATLRVKDGQMVNGGDMLASPRARCRAPATSPAVCRG
jgi:DNA-directed RNA polymerase subunit beta'